MIRRADSAADIVHARELFEEYARSLGIDLGFQNFAQELATLPGDYAPPAGVLLLATAASGSVAGCVGVRPLALNACEMKRLYVRPEARRQAAGRALAQGAIAFGRSAGYQVMRLDTLPSMVRAQALYRELGFREVAPYRHNPVPDTLFMELAL